MSALDWLQQLLGGSGYPPRQPVSAMFGNTEGEDLPTSALPPAVLRSILQQPSYGEGEVIPTQRDRSALWQEYAANPMTRQRSDALSNELGMLGDLRDKGSVYPEASNPWASTWARQGPYTRPQSNIPPQLRGLLSLY